MKVPEKSANYTLPVLGIIFLCAFASVVILFAKPPTPPTNMQWSKQWQFLQPFSIPRRALAAVATDGYLYVIGGVQESGKYVKQVEYAQILVNGKIGPWRMTSALNEGRFYLAAVRVNGYIYAIGGGSGPIGDNNYPVTTVERAKILPNGELGAWQHSEPLSTPRRGLNIVASNNEIYAIGGYNGIFLKSTEHSTVQPNGELGPWKLNRFESNIDRYIHSSAIYGNNLYVLGGHVNNANRPSYGDVERASISHSGMLGPWYVEQSALQTPRFIASAFALNGKLYILGGHNGGSRLNSVEFAFISHTGSVGKWQNTATLTEPRSASAVATYKNYVYVLGGMGKNQILNSVEWAQQNSLGELGIPVSIDN